MVKVNSSLSSSLPVLSGVPQGSVLGPLLFIIFINEIMLNLENDQDVKIALFADDSKFMSTHAGKLQSCLNNFSDVIKSFQLQLAPHKSVVLPIGKNSALQTLQSFHLESLQTDTHIKDLGIYIQNNLKWERHVNHVSRQAATISYQILKSIRSKNIWTLVLLYKCYVRPRLEYNTEVWSPYFKKDVQKLEQVQQQYTKRIFQRCNIPFLSYPDRLKKINLLSLQHRRIKFDLILMFKIINNLSELKFEDYFYFQKCNYSLRNNLTKIRPKEKFKGKVWTGSFFSRAPDYWNKLDNLTVSAKSLNVFKCRLRNVNFDVMS